MVLKSKVEHRLLNSTQHNCDFITESEFLLVKCLMTFIHQDLWYGKTVFAKYFQQMQDSYQTDWNFWQDKIKFCRTGSLSVIKLLSLFARNHRTFARQTEIFCSTLLLDLCTKESVYCPSSFSWETPIFISPVFQAHSQFQSQWVMISTAPNWRDKVICWNAGGTL